MEGVLEGVYLGGKSVLGLSGFEVTETALCVLAGEMEGLLFEAETLEFLVECDGLTGGLEACF